MQYVIFKYFLIDQKLAKNEKNQSPQWEHELNYSIKVSTISEMEFQNLHGYTTQNVTNLIKV